MEEHTAQRLCFRLQERMALLGLLASNKLLKKKSWADFQSLHVTRLGQPIGFHKPHTLGQLQSSAAAMTEQVGALLLSSRREGSGT